MLLRQPPTRRTHYQVRRTRGSITRPPFRWPIPYVGTQTAVFPADTRSDTVYLKTDFGAYGSPSSVIMQGNTLFTMNGIMIKRVGCAVKRGTGYIEITDLTRHILRFRGPQSKIYGTPVECRTDEGEYILEDGTDNAAYIRVKVYHDYLPTTITSTAVVFDKPMHNDLWEVTAAQATDGVTSTKTLTAYFDNAKNPPYDTRFWLHAPDAWTTISLDNSNFYAPTSETHPDVLTLATPEDWANYSAVTRKGNQPIYIKRIIPASTTYYPVREVEICYRWLSQ